VNQELREKERDIAEAAFKSKLYEIIDHAENLSTMDIVGIMNENLKLKSLVGQLDHLILEYRRRM
jgi:hypothetical protein